MPPIGAKKKFEVVTVGPHTLVHGDCLDYLPTLAPDSVSMIFTDPPYGHSNHDGDLNAQLNGHRGLENKPIENDDQESMRRVVDGMLTQAARVLKRDCCCCCCCCGGGGGPRPTFAWVASRMDGGGLTFFHSVIWDKANPGLGWRYRRQHEMVMVAHRQGGRLLWADDDVASPNIYRMMPPRDRMHPNEKPLGLVSHFLKLHSSEGQIILDPFMGTGGTGVACARMGRRFIGVEKDQRYFRIAVNRMKDELGLLYAGRKAPAVSGGKSLLKRSS